MSEREENRYFVKNCGDQAALPAELDRRKKRYNSIITKQGDSDFDTNSN